jgi:hypothetical protein
MEAYDIKMRWIDLQKVLMTQLNKRTDLQSVLYLIGVDELGVGIKEFTKEEKQDLIHLAICKVLSYSGYYTYAGTDADGWHHYESGSAVPQLAILEQEQLLKAHVIHHFEQIGVLPVAEQQI